jgi:1-acyl-sn-glycerol-3-phosphate acyltransferase/predicted protein tyrosine phosphatase
VGHFHRVAGETRGLSAPVLCRAPHRRIGVRYAAGALLLVGVAAAAGTAGLLLVWPAASLAVVAGAYLGARTNVLGKRRGRMAAPMQLLLGPWLLGQWLSLRYYRRRGYTWDVAAENVWIGARLNEREAADAVRSGVTAVVDLTAEFSEPRVFRALAYCNLQVLDLTAPSLEQLREASAFIVDHAKQGVVYVHCKAGYSRSAAVVGAYLLRTGLSRDVDECLSRLRQARPSIVIRPEVEAALRAFAAAESRPPFRRDRPAALDRAIGTSLAALARVTCTLEVQWLGDANPSRPRIFYANHSSHLDFLILWAALPGASRDRTVPVAAREYWCATAVRRYLATRVFGAVLVERQRPVRPEERQQTVEAARRRVAAAADALAANYSLVLFPEGTRGGGGVGAFKSGLYHLVRLRPDAELIPAYLENVDRILPKGTFLPVPLRARVTFGPPVHLSAGEEKAAFLDRARARLVELRTFHEGEHADDAAR